MDLENPRELACAGPTTRIAWNCGDATPTRNKDPKPSPPILATDKKVVGLTAYNEIETCKEIPVKTILTDHPIVSILETYRFEMEEVRI